MATIDFSPLVVGMSGRAGDAIFSRWKGRAYVRQFVKPANPDTAAQKIVRESLGRLPRLWRSLEAQVRTLQNAYAAAYALSGWNWFVQQNRVLEEANNAGLLTPPNVLIDPVQDFLLTDASGGSCTVTWSGGTQGAEYYVHIWKRLIHTAEVETVFTIEDQDTTLVSAETFAATLSASKDWQVILAVERIADHAFSMCVHDEITMGV